MSACLFYSPRLNLCVLTRFFPISVGVSPFICTSRRYRVSLELIRSRNCVPMAFTVFVITYTNTGTLSTCPLYTKSGCGNERTAPTYHTWVILSNHHPSTARDENQGKLLLSAPPLSSPFVPFLALFGSPAMNWDHAVSWGRGVWVSVGNIGRVGPVCMYVWSSHITEYGSTG